MVVRSVVREIGVPVLAVVGLYKPLIMLQLDSVFITWGVANVSISIHT